MFNHLKIYLLFVKKKILTCQWANLTYTTFSNTNITNNGTKQLHTSRNEALKRTHKRTLHLLAKRAIKLKDFLQIDAHYLYCFKRLRKCFWLKKTKGMCKLNARNDLELCLEGTIRTMGEIDKVCSSSNSIESMVFSCLRSIQWLQREYSCF